MFRSASGSSGTETWIWENTQDRALVCKSGLSRSRTTRKLVGAFVSLKKTRDIIGAPLHTVQLCLEPQPQTHTTGVEAPPTWAGEACSYTTLLPMFACVSTPPLSSSNFPLSDFQAAMIHGRSVPALTRNLNHIDNGDSIASETRRGHPWEDSLNPLAQITLSRRRQKKGQCARRRGANSRATAH